MWGHRPSCKGGYIAAAADGHPSKAETCGGGRLWVAFRGAAFCILFQLSAVPAWSVAAWVMAWFSDFVADPFAWPPRGASL